AYGKPLALLADDAQRLPQTAVEDQVEPSDLVLIQTERLRQACRVAGVDVAGGGALDEPCERLVAHEQVVDFVPLQLVRNQRRQNVIDVARTGEQDGQRLV